ncbi:MAG: PAS domain S-box protein [Candidatus Bathyarchaeota archaeon]|nr:PAS domain S-box protein [Candidatus Bathyarchaeota archaeon]
MSILVVSSNPSALKQMARFLETPEKVDFSTANSAQEALNQLKQKVFDVVICSAVLPGGAGLDLLRKLRQNGLTVPFILVAEAENDQAEIEALSLGAERYINVGGRLEVGKAELRQALASLVEKKTILDNWRVSEEKFYTLIDSAKDGIAMIDEQGRLVHWNNTCEQIFGYKKEEVLGKKLHFLMPPERVPAFEEANKNMYSKFQASSGAFSVKAVPMPGVRKDGTGVQTEMSMSFLSIGTNWLGLAIIRDVTERIKTENEILLEKERSKAILDSSPDAITFLDLNGKIVDCNEATLNLFGYSKEDLIGRDGLDLAVETDRNIVRLFGEKVLRKGVVRNEEARGLKKTGETFIAEFSGSRFIDNKGQPSGFVLTIKDRTESKKAEVALQNSEEHFRSLAENSPNMIFISIKGKLVYVNKETELVIGYTKEEFYSPDFDFMQLIAPEFKETVKSKFNRHMSGEEIGPYECKLVTKQGLTREVIINSREIRYNDEPALLGIATDITERKNATLEAVRAKEQFRVYVENSPVAVFVADSEGQYEYVNDAASKLLGYTRDELLTMSIIQLIFQEDIQAALAKFVEVKETGRSLSEIALKTKSGSPVYVILNSVKLPNGNLLAFCENVTERKKAEKEMRIQTERLKATFAASPDAIISINMEGNIVDCNEETLRIFNYPSKESLIGKPSLELAPESERPKLAGELRAVLENSKLVRNEEFVGVKGSGEEFNIEVSESTLKDYSGQPAGIIVTVRDVTERKKAEEQIRLLSSVVQQTVEGIAVSDTQGKILFVNSAWLKMHNFKEEEESTLAGQWVMKFYCNQQLEAIDKNFQPDTTFRGRITQVKKDGTTFAALATLSPLRNEKGEVIGIIHMAKPLTEIVRDIRDVKSANACAIKKEEAK